MAGVDSIETMVPIISYPLVLFISFVIGFTGLLFLWVRKQSPTNEITNEQEIYSQIEPEKQEKNPPPSKPNKKKANYKKSGQNQQFTHPHLITNLKGHSGPITGGDFSSNGKHFISASEDRTILIWTTKDWSQKEYKNVRGNIEYDHATHICWSPDSKAFIVRKGTANTIQVYKVGKKADGAIGNIQPGLEFSPSESTLDILALDMAITGKFIMTCDSKNQLLIWDLHGEILSTVDTRHGDTYSATLSPCGRFVATTGFTPDAKVWEVRFNKSGSFEGVKRVYELKGHKSGIYSCGFNQDSTKMVSLSRDGTWNLYDTNIEYDKGQEPYLLLSGIYEHKERQGIIRLSPDGRTIALASATDLKFYSAITGESLYTINDIFSGYIVDVKFDPSSKFVFTLGDKHTRIFHNVSGYKTAIQDLEKSKKGATNAAMRERIANQIDEAKRALKSIQEKVDQ